MRANGDFDDSAGEDFHIRKFVARTTAGDFDIIAKSATSPLATPRRFRLARWKARPIRIGQSLVQNSGKIANIKHQPQTIVVRQFCRFQQIAPPDFIHRHSNLARRRFQQPLHDIGAFRASGTAIGVHRRGIGKDAVHRIVDRGNIIHPADDAPACQSLNRRAKLRLISAKVRPCFHLQRGDFAIAVKGQRRICLHGAAMRIRLKGIRAFAR